MWERDGAGQPRVIHPDTEIPEKWRRVTVRKFRKEWSEGLLMPLGIAFSLGRPDEDCFQEDNDLADDLKITHWNPPEPDEIQSGGVSIKQSKIWPRSLKGWGYFLSYWLSFGLYNPWGQLGGGNEKAPENTPPVYDVEAYKNFTHVFTQGEDVWVTEKIHGSNFRAVFMPSSFGKGKFYVGSRKLWKAPKSGNVWRTAARMNPDIERWCRDNPKCVLYGEVTPTQKGFDYGATAEKPKVFLFDIRLPDGSWVPKPDARRMTLEYKLEWVPTLQIGGWSPDFAKFADGDTNTDGKHIREGCVVCTVPDCYVREAGRAQLKVISVAYYEKTKE